jgi:lipopolysaccharide biosynthesis protein/SAM-dependent methyltransferase
VLTVDNHGRDIFPFLALIRTGVLFNYELLCKVHSKRSAYREGGDAWRKTLVDGILGSTGLVERILEAFRSDTDLGMVVASGQIFGGRTFWVSNEVRLCRMFRDIGLNENAFERKFAGGSMYWIRPLILRPVNALNLGYDDFEAEPISSDGFTAHAVERIVSVICHDAGMRAAESGKLGSPAPGPSGKVHVIANYLPQFHPTPENDAWWGKGFTEWTNVTKALPQFRGHRQPRLPTDLGFYDLRLAEIRIAQADLARRHGITAFSYYYYWFNGRKLLNQPIESVLAAGQPDFPFMLCWANEPWTRNWDGLSKEVLLSQDYAPGWERVFAVDVAPLMRDPRYLRLNGKPMLALYRVAHFADMIGSIERLRAAFAAEGFAEVHLIGAWVQIGDDEKLPAEASEIGLDAYFEFPPHGIPSQPMQVPGTDQYPGFAGQLYDYGATVDAVLDELALAQPGFRHRGVMMGWDNTARRGARSFAFHGATPANFRRWLRAALQTARWEAHGRDNAVFINAWNEWAEGTYLEPDRDFGMGWLEAVASATSDTPNPPPVASRSPVLTEDFLIDDLIRRHMQPEIPDALARYTCGLERNHPEYVRSGAEVYLMFELTMRNFLGKSMIEMGNVLDFGCGAGRLLRFLDPSTSRVCACDVNAAVIRFAQAHYGHFSIYQNGLMPPLIYDSGQFDLIYSFSVFSHLSEDVENQWLAELSRVGKSGCIYLISVHGDWFIEATLGDEARAVAEAGFVWKSAHQRRGSEDDFPDYYEASFHTSDFIRAHWSRYFEIVAIVKGDDPRRFLGTNPDQWSLAIVPQLRPMGQDLIIARKR